MKTVDQIAQQLTPGIQANNAATGETNRRLAFIGDGQGNAQPATKLTPRDVFYRSSLDQNDRGVAILSPRCPIPIQAINGYYNVEVWVANVPGSSQVQIVDLADAGSYATGGPTPLEGLANAGAKPSQDQLLIFRLAPPIDSSMSVFIDAGPLGSIAYEVGDGTMGFAASASADISDSTNPVTFNPTASALASGEHRLLGIALDPTTGQYFAIPGAAQSTSETLPSANSRSEFVETDYQAIDFTGYYPCGYVYNYYGQTSPVEDDIMRQFDPRLFANPFNVGTGGTFYQTVQGNGTPATQEPIIDFIDGTNTAVTVTDDGAGTRTKVKIDVTGVTSGINQLTGDVTAGPGTGSQAATVVQVGGASAANVAKAVAALADKFLLQTADATNLPNAQAMGALATGIVKNATTTGVQSIATAGTDYTTPAGTENLSNKTITASSLNSTPIGASSASSAIFSAFSLLIGGFKAIFTHANTADRTYTYPDKNGTVAMTSDVPSVPLTTKGDLLGFDSADARVPIGTNNQVLTADSAQTLGLKWTLVSLVNSITGILGLANGGTGADLSGTGGANKFVKQSTLGAVLSVGTIASADIATALTTPGPIGGTTPNNVTALKQIFAAATTLTVSSNTVAVTQTYHIISPSVGHSATLNTATGGTDGQRLILVADSGATITIKNGSGASGQFAMIGSADLVLSQDNKQIVEFIYSSGASTWYQIAGAAFNGELISGGTVAAARLGLMTGDSGTGGLPGAITGPSTGDAVHGFFGDGTYQGTGRKLVDFTTLGADAANIDLTSISGSYKSLQLLLFLRTDRAATNDNVYIRLNNDSTAANYFSNSIRIATATIAGLERLGATATAIEILFGAVGSTGIANDFSVLIVDIFAYQITANSRAVVHRGWARTSAAAGNQAPLLGGGSWLNQASAISRITILPVTGSNFKAGSSYMLYGAS